MAFFSKNNKIPLGIYVHVPFCRSKCQYCDFYSLTTKEGRVMDKYLEAVCDHIREAGALAPAYLVDTIYLRVKARQGCFDSARKGRIRLPLYLCR